MKKKIIAVLLFVTIITIGCTPYGENAIQSDKCNYKDEIPSTYQIYTDDDNNDTYDSDYSADVSDCSLTFTTNRVFDVVPGDYGYLAVAFIEHMQDYLPYRLPFSDRELEAALWIVDALLDMGFEESQIEIQTFRYDTKTSSWWGDPHYRIETYTEAGYYNNLERIDYSQNIILTIPGHSDKTIIIGAHYDGVGNPGISDNAASVALLLENAYRMKSQDHYHTLQYVFFGAEEVGLIGAFYFVDNLYYEDVENIVLVINADVIVEGPNFKYAVGYIEDGMLFTYEGPTISQNQLTLKIDALATELAYEGITLTAEPQAVIFPTDHLAFLEFGVPILYFYGTYPPVYPELLYRNVLHTPNDCLDFFFEHFPGRIEDAMNTFGRFLEFVLLNI